MTLLERINLAEARRRELAVALLNQDGIIAELKAMRLTCQHEFSPPFPGYEHEGGTCLKCGINEVYWASNMAPHGK